MRYVSFVRYFFLATIFVGLLSEVFFSSTAYAAGVTYTVDSGKNITFQGLSMGSGGDTSATIKKGSVQSSSVSCRLGSGSAKIVMLKISNKDSESIASGKAPKTIEYSMASNNPNDSGACMKGDKATLVSDKEESSTAQAEVNATAESLLKKVPKLSDSAYRGKLSENDANKAIATCVDYALAQPASSSSGAYNDASQKTSKEALNEHFSKCYSEKTGTSASKIKDLLDKAPGNPIQESAQSGKEVRGGEDKEGDEKSCGSEVSGIGWIVCPVINALSTLNDGLWKIIEGLLQSNPLEQNGPMYDLWIILRNIANALLVVGFIAVIYSQLTGVGISNYGIKKMLPRIIIVAIAINLSYFIVSIMVDVFNILGSSLNDLLDGVYGSLKLGDDFSWGSLMGLVLGSTGAVAIGGVAVLASGGTVTLILLMLPSALAGLIGFLAALLTLMFRQAAIPLLAILAPIAFVAYLLPNTESLFTKWRKMFTSMLILYPLAALLFGGMKVAGAVIASGGSGTGKAFALLTGLIVMAAPLFMLPFLAKQSGSMLGVIGGKLQGLGGKLSKPVGGWSKGRAEQQRKRYESKPIRMKDNGKPFVRDRMRSWRQNSDMKRRTRDIQMGAYGAERDAKFNDYVMGNQESLAKGQGDVGQAYIAATAKRARAEAVKNAEMNVSSGDLDNVKSRWHQAVKSGDGVTAEAMQNKMLGAGGYGQNVYREALREAEAGGYMSSSIAREQKNNLLDNHGGVKNSSADLMKWASDKGNAANNNTPRSLSEVGKDKSTWTMSDADFASQHMLSQKEAISNGAIGDEQAYRIASDQRLSKDLAPDIRDKINELAESYTPPANATAEQAAKIADRAKRNRMR